MRMHSIPTPSIKLHSIFHKKDDVILMQHENKSELMWKSYWPAGLVSIIFVLLVFINYLLIIKMNNNVFVYTIDDAYIHMAISKNLVENGVYGPTPYAFEPASSSLSWNFILAGIYLITGVNIFVPLVMNIVSGILAIFSIQKVLLSWYGHVSHKIHALILLIFIWVIPLITMSLIGMEHVLQILVSIWVLFFAVELLTQPDKQVNQIHKIGLIFSLSFLFTIRFEAFFIASIIILLLLLRRHFLYTILVLGTSAFPLMLMSIFFVNNDRGFLPNSVLVKSQLSSSSGYHILVNIFHAPSILLFLVFSIIYLIIYSLRHKQWLTWQKPQIILIIVTGAAFQHLIFGSFGWFYRYEAYLIPFIILAGLILVKDYWDHKNNLLSTNITANTLPTSTTYKLLNAFLQLTFMFFIILLGYRGLNSTIQTPNATHNFYLSTYQVGTFLTENYEGQAVMLNDIGYPVFSADIKLLDLVGLGSYEWIEVIADDDVNVETIDQWAKDEDAQLAILYDFYTPDASEEHLQIPSTWVLVGTWQLNRPLVIGFNDTWKFYAMNEESAQILHRHLLAFEEQLPEDVSFTDLYGD